MNSPLRTSTMKARITPIFSWSMKVRNALP